MRAKSLAMVWGVVCALLLANHGALANANGVSDGDPAQGSIEEADCGYQSLAHLLARKGQLGAANQVQKMVPASKRGVSVQDLVELSGQYGYTLKAYRANINMPRNIPTPAIIHLNATKESVTGHFQVLISINGNQAVVYDAQRKQHRFTSMAQLARAWSGVFLVLGSTTVDAHHALLSMDSAEKIYGGLDGAAQVPAGGSNLGGSGSGSGSGGSHMPSPCGSPSWEVNRVNFNLVVTDIPVWYQPAIGPQITAQITYNSQDVASSTAPFGSKWRFIYNAFLVEDSGTGDVTVVFGDGRSEAFTSDGIGGYNLAYGTFNRVIKVGDNHFELRTPQDEIYVFQMPGDGWTTPVLVELNNPRGQGLRIGYNASGQLATISDPLGRTTTLTYTDDKVTRISDPFGRHADFEYTGDQLTRVTDMGGVWAVFNYDVDDNLTSIEKERGVTTFLIEGGGSANAATYPAPGAILGAHRRITITDPLGKKEEYYYNGLVGYGWYVSPKDYIEYVDDNINNSAGDVPKTLYYYEDTVEGQREEIGSVVYPEGRQITNVHDFNTGKVLSISDSYGNTTTYTYNPMGRVATITPEVGAPTTNVYSAANNVDLEASTIQGLGAVSATYNSFHDVTQTVDRTSKQNDYTYNTTGQVATMIQTHDDHTITTVYTYYPSGHPSAHRLQQVSRAGQVVAAYTYDTVGRVATQTDAAGLITTRAYNNLNQVTRETHADTRFMEYTYSSCCPKLIDSVTDRAGRTTFYEYDALERLIKTVNPEGGIQRFEYDPNGNLVAHTNPNLNTTRFEYDGDNRISKRIWADGRTITYQYDKEGRLEVRTDARGIQTFYSYDANDNLIDTHYSDGTPAVNYAYDAFNRLERRGDATGATHYTYFADGAVQSVDGPLENDTLTYAYDRLGRLTGLTPQLGQVQSYGYDDLDRLTTVQTGARNFTYGYTGADPRVQTLTRPQTGQTTYTYADPLKRLTAVLNSDSGDQMINRFDYAYADTDHPDQRSSETFTNGPDITFSADQLTTYDYNVVEQLINESTNGNLVYDDDGNLIQGYTPDGDLFDATYDAENRMTAITYTGVDTTVYRSEFVYRADNFLSQIRQYENGTLVGNTRIVRAGLLASQERDAANQIIREYTWGPNLAGGIGGLLNMRNNATEYAYLYDGKGNVSAVLDMAQGVAAAYRYDSFGRIVTLAGTLDQPFQFSTKRYLASTGLTYYGYRYYTAAMSRWLTRDPIEEAGGINLYGFVQNNPVNWIDPYGLRRYGSASSYFYGGSRVVMQGVEQGFNNTTDAIIEGTDTVLNNPLTEPLDVIPPGEPITGWPVADFWINVFNAIRGVLNTVMGKECP